MRVRAFASLAWWTLVILLLAGPQALAQGPDRASGVEANARLFLPIAARKADLTRMAGCTIAGTQFGTLTPLPPPSDRPAAQHADLNAALRGERANNAQRGLIDLNGSYDERAPRLRWLFGDLRTPTIGATYQVYDWNWSCNCRGGALTQPEVTKMALATAPGEVLRTPASGYDLGSGFTALVLYADPGQITLKYTRNDNVVSGYTLHIQNVCIEANLLRLYESLNQQGLGRLPALKSGQPFARAAGDWFWVAVRDTGSFMDPRSRKDWWR